MVQPIRVEPQRKGLHTVDGLLCNLTVGKNARKFGDFCKPATVIFLFDFNGLAAKSASFKHLAHLPDCTVATVLPRYFT